MADLELYGCWTTPEQARAPGYPFAPLPISAELEGAAYVIGARCSTGCHRAAVVISASEVLSSLPLAEQMLRSAFRRHHG